MVMQALHYLGPGKLDWREVPDAALVAATDAIVRPLAVATGEQVRAIEVGDVVLASFQPSCGACAPCQRHHSAACAEVVPTAMYGIGKIGGDWPGALADAIRVPWADVNLRRLPRGVAPAAAASASDNFADGVRGVDDELRARPGASVLVAG